MEDQLPDLPTLAPGLGVLGLLMWFLIRVMRQSSGDRSGYEKAIADLATRHDTQIAEVRKQHDDQIAELRQQHTDQIADLRGQVTILRQEVADLRTEVERQRALRWAAEETAARYRRQLGLPAEEVPGG